jgi:hypothetical protein
MAGDYGDSMWSSNPWGAALLTGLGGAAGAFPTNTSGSGSSSGTTNLTSSADALSQLVNAINLGQTQTTSQQLDPETQAFLNKLMSHFSDIASTGVDMSGFTGSGLSDINRSFNGAQTNLDTNLAARGLSTSPVAAAASAGLQAQRATQQSTFLNSIPLLKNQLQLANLTPAANFFSMIPRTVSSTGTQTGSTTQTGNQVQQGSTNQNQQSNQNYKQASGGGWGSLLGGLASVGGMLAMASDKNIKENIMDDTMPHDMAFKAVMKLKPKTFNYKGESVSEGHHGFIAQDVEKVLPHAVKNIGGVKHIDYAAMIPTLVKAVQHMGKMQQVRIAAGKEPKE